MTIDLEVCYKLRRFDVDVIKSREVKESRYIDQLISWLEQNTSSSAHLVTVVLLPMLASLHVG